MAAGPSREAAARFTALADTPLGLSVADLRAAMDPFVQRVVSPGDTEWRTEVARKTAKTRRRLRRRRLLGWLGVARRGQDRIGETYGPSWARKRLPPYASERPSERVAAWTYAGQAMFATMAAGARARLLLLMRAIGWLRPRTVLEVGAGNGVNLMVLACRYPEIRVAGLELTASGVAVARETQALAPLPSVLQRFAPEPLVDL